jgi:hypothetical protein
MGKVLRPLAIVAAVAVNVIPGAGQAISGALVGALGGTFTAAAVGTALAGVAVAGLTVGGLSAAASVLQRRPRFEASGITSRPSLSDQVPQWLAIGETALPVQMIYWGTSGADNKELSIIYAHACHAIDGFTGLRINDVATTFPTPGGQYAGILSIQTATGAHVANPFTDVQGDSWGAGTIGRDLAMSHFRWRYDQDKLQTGLPQSIQFTGRGIRVYDPRRDSTRGGSGTMRADNESTWAYQVAGTALGNNPALVHLSYRLGWRKNGKLWAGMGTDPANINYAEYIAAANICDELVSGQRRYTINGLLSLADAHNVNLSKILAACGGKPTNAGGLRGIWVAHDDTAVPVMSFDQRDIIGDIRWEPLPEGVIRNTARGSFLDPAQNWTAQPYDEIRPADLLALDNGVELADQIDFGLVTDATQARRIAGIRVRESRQGVLVMPLRLKAMGVDPANIIALTLPQQGWALRRFRVEAKSIDGEVVTLRCRAVAASDYAAAGPSALVPPAPPNTDGFVPPAVQTASADANRVRYSLMEGDRGWRVTFNPSNVIFTSNFGTFDGRRFFAAQATATAAGQVLVVGQAGAPVAEFPLRGGERLSVQARIDAFGAAVGGWALSLWLVRQDGSRTQSTVASGSGASGVATVRSGFVDVPTTGSPVIGGYIDIACESNGAGAMQLAIVEPMVTSAAPGQTLHPPFVPGPGAAVGADVTGNALPALPQGAWMEGREYRVGDLVFASQATWTAREAHTSSAANRPGIGPWTAAVASPAPGVQGTTATAFFSSGAMSSTSYGPALATVALVVGSAGIVDLSATGTTDLDAGTAASATLRVQREVSPGVWADVGTAAGLPALDATEPTLQSRDFSATWQATGLTVGSTQTFRIQARRSSGAAGSEVSASGLLTGAGR